MSQMRSSWLALSSVFPLLFYITSINVTSAQVVNTGRFSPVLSARLVDPSSYGTHFILGLTEQHPSYQNSGYIKLSILAPFGTNVTITAATSRNPLYTSYIQAGQVMEYKLPLLLRMQGTRIERKGIEVRASSKIAVVCFNHASSTTDAYLALPTHALGTIHVAACYTPTEKGNIGIISGSDNTEIVITLNSGITVVYGGATYDNHKPLRITLAKLETFHIKHSSDLSGTIVVSNKPVSVITGNTCANVGKNGACDHLAVFLLPVKNWGMEFVVIPTGTINRNAGDMVRVFAYENNTAVDGPHGTSIMSSGKYKEIDLGRELASSINCSKPCQVIQYVKAQNINGKIADPSMIVVPSVNQFLSYYTVAPNAESYSYNSISLLIKVSHKNGLNKGGVLMTSLQWQAVTGTEYVWTVFTVSGSNPVTISHNSSHATFGVLVFGWGASMSYGYPGGFTFSNSRIVNKVPPEKCSHSLDLGFVLDSSGSITDQQYQEMKNFVKDMTKFFTINQHETRISLMSFSTTPTMHIFFKDQFTDGTALNQSIDSTAKDNGGTATADALNLAYNTMFSTVNGARSSAVGKVLIILTDGQSNSGMVHAPAQRLKDSGVTIFSVGLGNNIKLGELNDMASDPDNKHVILLDSFVQLSTLAKRLSNKTCNALTYTVRCNDDSMELSVRKSSLPIPVSASQLFLQDQTCTARENDTHFSFNTTLGACGATYTETDWTISFTNVVRNKPAPDDSVITRVDDVIELHYTCSYDRKQTIGAVSFKPAHTKIRGKISGVGNFTLRMDLFETGNYQSRLTKLPVTKKLGENIHVQYSISTSGGDLVVFAETCKATPTNRPYDRPQYYIIRNGCATDKTMRYIYTLKPAQQFSIQSFKFLADHLMVYLHCDLIVCNRNTPNSPCTRGLQCSSPRRRRRADDAQSLDDRSRRYALSVGPFMLSKEDKPSPTGDKSKQSVKFAIGAGSAIAVLLVLVATLVMMKRRSFESDNSNSQPTLTAQGKSVDVMALENTAYDTSL